MRLNTFGIVLTFGTTSVKLILSTRSVTNVYGNGVAGSKFGISMCWCTTQTANKSMSSISRPSRTLPKNVTYLSCSSKSFANGITADVKESCIDLGGNSLLDFGSNCSKCSRLCFNTEYLFGMPSFFVIFTLTADKQTQYLFRLIHCWDNRKN